MTSPKQSCDFSNRYPKHWLDLPWQERNQMVIGLIEHELSIAHQFLSPLTSPKKDFSIERQICHSREKLETHSSKQTPSSGKNLRSHEQNNKNEKKENEQDENREKKFGHGDGINNIIKSHDKLMENSRHLYSPILPQNSSRDRHNFQENVSHRAYNVCARKRFGVMPQGSTNDLLGKKVKTKIVGKQPQIRYSPPSLHKQQYSVKKHSHSLPKPSSKKLQSRNPRSHNTDLDKKMPIIVAPKPPPRLPAMHQRLLPVETVTIGDSDLNHARVLPALRAQQGQRCASTSKVRLGPVNDYGQTSKSAVKSYSLSNLPSGSCHNRKNVGRCSEMNNPQKTSNIYKMDGFHTMIERPSRNRMHLRKNMFH